MSLQRFERIMWKIVYKPQRGRRAGYYWVYGVFAVLISALVFHGVFFGSPLWVVLLSALVIVVASIVLAFLARASSRAWRTIASVVESISVLFSSPRPESLWVRVRVESREGFVRARVYLVEGCGYTVSSQELALRYRSPLLGVGGTVSRRVLLGELLLPPRSLKELGGEVGLGEVRQLYCSSGASYANIVAGSLLYLEVEASRPSSGETAVFYLAVPVVRKISAGRKRERSNSSIAVYLEGSEAITLRCRENAGGCAEYIAGLGRLANPFLGVAGLRKPVCNSLQVGSAECKSVAARASTLSSRE